MAERGAARKRTSEDANSALGAVAGTADPGPLELDRLIHERVRLGIVSALAVNGSVTFTDLRGCSTPPTETSARTRASSRRRATSPAGNRLREGCQEPSTP